MERPETRFAKADGAHIAYQVFGDGPEIVVIAGGVSHLELRWHMPASAAFYRKLAEFCRVIIFDKRGVGLSERTVNIPPLEEQVDDVLAVMTAAGSTAAFVHGYSDGGALAAMFAAREPDATLGLIVEGCPARAVSGPDYPFGFDPEEWERLASDVEEWSLDEFLEWSAPELTRDQDSRDTFVRYAAAGAGPAGLAAVMRFAATLDLRSVLPTIHVPTLVLARTRDVLAPLEGVRCLAEGIPGSTFVVLNDADTSSQEYLAAVLDEVQHFVTGTRPVADADRVLATVLFVDVANSTQRASELGDARWRELLDRHDDEIRRVVEEFGGRVVKATGDGALATFGAPARGVRAAIDIQRALERIGIATRVGLHTGEVERRGDDIAGLAVHIAARVEGVARPGEIVVTRTVTDLVVGSGLTFEDHGYHQLKGVTGEWQLFRVVTSSTPANLN